MTYKDGDHLFALTAKARLELAEIVKKTFDFNPLITKGGYRTPYYVNGQVIVSDPAGLYLAATAILQQLYDWQIGAVAGEVAGASPLIGTIIALSYQYGKPLKGFYIRKDPKVYGLSGYVNVPVPAGISVAIVDDVAVSGETALRCLQFLREAGARVEGFASIIDKNLGARTKLEKAGIKFHSLFSVDDFHDYISARINPAN